MKSLSLILIGIWISSLISLVYRYNTPCIQIDQRDYQVQCTPDSIILYDGSKRIGVIDYDDNSKFSELILNDNL